MSHTSSLTALFGGLTLNEELFLQKPAETDEGCRARYKNVLVYDHDSGVDKSSATAQYQMIQSILPPTIRCKSPFVITCFVLC